LFRITYYYLLFQGILVSVIDYPYKKLEETIGYYREILNNLPMAVVTGDSETRLTYANKKAEELSGYSLKDLRGLSERELAEKI
jgi:PAS domain-containing protein